MTTLTPRAMLDAVDEGLEESALLVALGYDASQGRPGRYLMNNALERLGYGRPIGERDFDALEPHHPHPDAWISAIAKVVTGRPDAPITEIIGRLEKDGADGRKVV